MISILQRLIGHISVEEKDGVITVSGIKTRAVVSDMKNMWNSVRIPNNLFISQGAAEVSLDSFFAYEFYNALDILSEQSKTYLSRGVILKIMELLKENTWLGREVEVGDVVNYRRLRNFNLKPLDHQSSFIESYAINTVKMGLNGYYLASPPGSGKTFSGLLLHGLLELDTMIIVCPKNAIREVWLDNIEKYVKGDKECWLSDSGTPPPKGMDYYICHYEALPVLLNNVDIFKRKDVFIDLDESHHFNEVTSARTLSFIELCRQTACRHILWSSGTPFKKLATEMVSFLRACDPLFTPEVEKRFKGIFGVSSSRANDILARRIGKSVFNVDKTVVRTDDPIEEDIKVQVKDSDRFTLEHVKQEMLEFITERLAFYKEHYNSYLQDFEKVLTVFEQTLRDGERSDFNNYLQKIDVLKSTSDYRPLAELIRDVNAYEDSVIYPRLSAENRKEFKRVKGVVKYVELVIRGEALGRVLGRRRIECFKEIAKVVDYDGIIKASKKKVLIFSSFVEVVDIAVEHLKPTYKPAIVYGDTNKNIVNIMERFDNDSKVNPLVATLKSLSTAIPVISANTVVFLNNPFRDYEKNQAVSRVDRLGQDTQTYVINILLDTGDKQNLSTRNLDIMKWSKAEVDRLMGETLEVNMESLTEGDIVPLVASSSKDSGTASLSW